MLDHQQTQDQENAHNESPLLRMAQEQLTLIDRLKRLAEGNKIVQAAELPFRSNRITSLSEIEHILDQFDLDERDYGQYAHFLVRVKRREGASNQFSQTSQSSQNDPTESSLGSVTIDQMVEETLNQVEQKQASNEREDLLNSTPPIELLKDAENLENNQEHELAINIYTALLKRGSYVAESYFGLARCFEKSGKTQEAELAYKDSLSFGPQIQTYLSLIRLFIRLERNEDAVRYILNALKTPELDDRFQFELHKLAGNCYLRLRDDVLANKHYQEAYQLRPDSDSLLVNMGSLEVQRGNFIEAEKHFSDAIKINPENPKALCGLGMVEMGKKNYPQAILHLEQSFLLDGSNVSTLYHLVRCSYASESFQSALKCFEHYFSLNPRSPEHLSVIYSYAGVLHQASLNESDETRKIELRNKSSDEANQILSFNPQHSGAKELKERLS